MKRILCSIALLMLPTLVAAQAHKTQQGTIIRMRMTDCLGPQHGFMAAMSGGGKVESGALCPEYVLVADQVVYVISGKTSDALIPLAEITRFRLQKNEMLVRIDDASKESHFHIKSMVLRPEWDRTQQLEEAESHATITHQLDPAMMESAALIHSCAAGATRNLSARHRPCYLRGLPTRCAVANILATLSRSLGWTFPAGIRMCVRSSSFSSRTTSAIESIRPE